MAIAAPSARWKPQALVGELARAGWGDLAGAEVRGATSVLTQLADLVNPYTGEGTATLLELAGRAQFSRKWVARSLRRLEDCGLVEYTPGGVEAGRGVPSRFRLVKTVLVQLLVAARAGRRAVLEAEYQAVRERIAAARLSWTRRRPPRPRNRRSAAENSVPASPPLRGTPAAVPTEKPPLGVPMPANFRDLVAQARAEST